MGVALAVWLSGCASTPAGTAPSAPNLASVKIADIPFFPQERFQCGPASLAMLLHWAGRPVSPDLLEAQIYLSGRRGTLQLEILGAARKAGVLPYEHAGGFDDLWQLLAAGKPALVLQNLAFSWYPKWHYALVVGYDAATGELLLHSARDAYTRQSLKAFARSWHDGNQWLVSLSPPGKIPVAAQELALLAAANDFELVQQPTLARSYYRAATQHWPQSMAAWLALGNSEYNRAAYAGAESAFRRALAVASEHPAPAHNLAWALIRQGRDSEALEYAKRAVAYSGALPEAQQSRYVSALTKLRAPER